MDVWDVCDVVDEESSLIMRCYGSVFISWMWMMMLERSFRRSVVMTVLLGNDGLG